MTGGLVIGAAASYLLVQWSRTGGLAQSLPAADWTPWLWVGALSIMALMLASAWYRFGRGVCAAATTSGVVLQRTKPRLFVPLNRAPTTGPVAPFTHWHFTVSGLHSPIRVTSDTRSYSFSGGALTWACASPRVPFFMRPSVPG